MVTAFSREQGKIRGLVRGGRKKRADLQPGNLGKITWRRRLETQLGTFTWENTASPATTTLRDFCRLQCVQYVAEVLTIVLPEGQSYPAFYDSTDAFLRHLKRPHLPERLACWELLLLAAAGYGLSLSRAEAVPCPSGTPLTYVSPNTGRAVSQAKGTPYKDKLLKLPQLFGGPAQEEREDRATAFQLTGFFLERAVHGRKVQTRQPLVESLLNISG